METTLVYGIEDLRREIAHKTRGQQIDIIKQAKINYGLQIQSAHHSGGKNSTKYEKDFEENAEILLKEIEGDHSFKYDCDWNWFFNADNIPNQKLVFTTKDFLELKRKEIDSLFILNAVKRQSDELKEYLDKPVDFVQRLKSLPLGELQLYIVLGLILKWHGGYPVNNLNPKYDTILKLIEREFLNMFPGPLTPEKEFCATDIKTEKRMKEAEAHINAAFKVNHTFTESRYLDRVSIDFEDLPKYVIQRGIIWRFEEAQFRKDAEYQNWRNELLGFLETIPKAHVVKTLEKGIEYGKRVHSYHMDNECDNPANCILNQSWERRIAIAENILETAYGKGKLANSENTDSDSYKMEYSKIFNSPAILLSEPEKLWFGAVYSRMKEGLQVSAREILGKLHNQLPATFRHTSLNEKIISRNGEEIFLPGVIALERNFKILDTIDKVVHVIKSILLASHEKTNISVQEIAEEGLLESWEVSVSLHLIRNYGSYFTSAAFDTGKTLFRSIDIGGNEAIFNNYIYYTGIRKIILLKSYQAFSAKKEEEFTADEMISMTEKIDSILQEIKNLKLGQEIIWTDILAELNEMKTLYSLNKKTWKQLFAGKIMDMTVSGIISETLSKHIVESMRPFIGTAINQIKN